MGEMVRVVLTGDHVLRLPEGCRFDSEVFVRREGTRVVLETADDAIDPETGLTIARLRVLIQEGLDSGPDEPLDMADIKRRGRERLAAGNAR